LFSFNNVTGVFIKRFVLGINFPAFTTVTVYEKKKIIYCTTENYYMSSAKSQKMLNH
uniref:Glycoprotein B n=1 Tax=Brugia timori TaxID=42155 RepID=A0A0R3Q8D1_9BILA